MNKSSNLQSKHERAFWNDFTGLLIDDPENPLNNLIGQLRNMAIEYFENIKERKPCKLFKRAAKGTDRCICGYSMLKHEYFKNFKKL